MELKCIAISTSMDTLNEIERMTKQLWGLALTEKCQSLDDAHNIIEHDEIDLIFSDTKIPGQIGLDFAQSLKKPQNRLIFVSDTKDFAADAFAVGASDYLVRPLTLERFIDAVKKVERCITLSTISTASTKPIFVRVDRTMRRLHAADIMYVKAMSEYVQIKLKDVERMITVHGTMKSFETMLPKGIFMRTHKSYIINLKHLELVSGSNLTIDGEQLPIGDTYRGELMQFLKSNCINDHQD